MTRLALNKSTLHRESRKLKTFRRFVPALDMKRQQILSVRRETQNQIAERVRIREAQLKLVAEQLPMLAVETQIPDPLIQIKTLKMKHSNLVGLHLSELEQLEIEIAHYSRLQVPHWVDPLAEHLREVTRLDIELRILRQKLNQLEEGLRKTTQRLNLFDKVLIPKTQHNIRRISIALSDGERAGVVRAKIAKSKRRRMALQ